MELFSVICTTCQSKLKVRDTAVIGQILACPKCQGMVLVQPPAGWTPDSVSSATPVATTAQPTVPQPQTSKPISHSSSTFDDAAALLDQPKGAAIAPPVAEVAPALVPPGEWVSPQTQAMRRWLLFGGVASIGAVALIGALAYALSEGDQAVAVIEQPSAAASEQPLPVADEDQPPADAPATIDAAPMPVSEAPATEPAIEEPPAPQPPMPPVDPAPIIAAEPSEPTTEDAAPQPLNTFNVEGTLKQFGALIEEKPFEEQPQGEPARIPEGLETSSPSAPVTEEEPLPRPDARRIDIARRLNDPLAAIEVNDLPLADFLQLVTEMSTLPITLDTTALPAIKTSAEAKVSVRLQDTKVADVLTAALKPHNLAYLVTDRHVTVVPIASTKSELRQIKHEVGDLAKTPAEAISLAEIIHAVVEPASWDDAGGRGTIEVEGTTITIAQTPEAHFATVVLCEKLRLARGLATRSAYAPTVLTLAPRVSAADALLDTPVTMNFVPPTRLTRVADHIKRTAGLRVLIDWRALAAAGWTPEGEVKAGVAGLPLAAFLDHLCRRMEIAWRVIDSGTVELTSREALLTTPDLEVYPLAADDGAALIGLVQKQLGAQLFGPGAPGVLRYDAASQALLARLPQPAQRKLIELVAKLKQAP